MGRVPGVVLSPVFMGGEWRRDAPIPPRAGIHFTASL